MRALLNVTHVYTLIGYREIERNFKLKPFHYLGNCLALILNVAFRKLRHFSLEFLFYILITMHHSIPMLMRQLDASS